MYDTVIQPAAQVDLPGQACVADGPIDHTGMYVMHYALRRDIADLVAAAAHTPPGDAGTWRALAGYWALFDELLHHHHAAEDDHYWPVLATAVAERGTDADREVLAAMASEHAGITPAVDACRAGFTDMLARPDGSNAAIVRRRLAALGQVIGHHMAHEERDALPMVHRLLTAESYAGIERAIGRSYPIRLVFTLVPWAFHGLSGPSGAQLLAKAKSPERLMLRLNRGRFERRHRAAFRYLPRT